jgi:endonuclease G
VWATDRNSLIIYVGPIVLNSNQTIGKDHVVVPTAFWKVLVDPTNGDALAFVMSQKDIAIATLLPWQTSIHTIEQAAGIELPLPNNTDRDAKPHLWPADLKRWNAKHKAACGK